MNAILQHDLNEIAFILEKVKQQGITFLNAIDTVPTSTKNTITTDRKLNEIGVGSLAALEELILGKFIF